MSQTESGKAFEYAIANKIAVTYKVRIEPKYRFDSIHQAFISQTQVAQKKCMRAADEAMKFLFARDTRFNNPGTAKVDLLSSTEGKYGDVRDIVIQIEDDGEIGISAKNRHQAVKHSRLSANIDFGNEWMSVPCSDIYWHDIEPVFDVLGRHRGGLWKSIENKHERFYIPLLNAFVDELKRLHEKEPGMISENLLRYLLGKHDFYKVVKENGEVSVQSYNFAGTLEWGMKTKLSGQIVKAGLKGRSKTTAEVIFDNGWNLSFRLHNASSKIETSLKFDIQIIGLPPTIKCNEIKFG